MEESVYKEIEQVGNYHWWYVGKNILIFTLLKKYLSRKKKNLKLLDVGCGAGIILKEMEKIGIAYGIDNSEEAIEFCRNRTSAFLYKADAEKLPFENNFFDVITCADVLEHIDEDQKVVKEIARVLNKEGIFLLSVPAYKFLWSYRDIISHHKRRYNLKEVLFLVNNSGLSIKKITHTNFFIFPAFFLWSIIEKLRKKKTGTVFFVFPKPINALLIKLYKIEAFLLTIGFNLPAGSSILCLAIKTRKYNER